MKGTSVDQYLKHMKDITDKLAAIGAPISEEDQVVTLLGSLPRSFATLVTAIETRMDGVSLDYVQQALIHEEMKQSELSVQFSGTDSALAGAFNRNTPRERPTCYGCGNVGHIYRYCPHNSPRDLPTWLGCGDVGHIQRYCPTKRKWHKAKIAESEESRQGNSNVDREDVYAPAFMAPVGNVESADREYPWLIDSGASSHMTKERPVLTNFQEFEEPANVALGDGSVLKALGYGRVQMNMLFPGTETKKAVLYDMCCTCLNSPATCFLYELQLLKVTLLNLALTIDVSGMKMESFVERGHLLINSINWIVKLSPLGTPQLRHLVATCGINVSDMCTSHASRNAFRMSLCKGLTSRK